jgi:peptidyl-prolyl cis-trans isomerase SurA
MQQKTTILKHTKSLLLSTAFLFLGFSALAQKVKIDGVAVVIGKNIVLDSDIEKFKQEIVQRSEGKIDISDCEMLEELMQQKLLAHHAIIDSVVVTDAEISASVERKIEYFKQQTRGDIQKVVDLYGFNDLEDLKKEMTSVETETLLIQREQQKITGDINVTPEEVRIYYNSLKDKGELPEFAAEVKLAQLVIDIKPTEKAKQKTIDKLNELKKEIEEGSSFRLKAIINSEDPSVTQNGGEFAITKESGFVKEFKETAFSLDIGQISEPFETIFGYHIVQLNGVKGNTRVVSHILISPEIPESKILEAKETMEEVLTEIKSGKITFKEAVKKYSTDKFTKNNEGLFMNPKTGEATFDLTRMDPALYARVSDLDEGEMTEPFFDEDREGKKYKFLKIIEKTKTHTADLVRDYEKIQNLALRKKQEEAIEKWSKSKIGDTYVKLSDEHQKCTFERNWKKTIRK